MGRDMLQLLNTLKPDAVERQRLIAIAGCSYSQIIQCRDWLPDEIGGIAWFSFDNPGQSPRIPIFSGTLSLPESFKVGGQHRFRTDAALWHFRRANRLATVRWGAARSSMEQAVSEFEEKAFAELPLIETRAVELYKQHQKELKKLAKAQKQDNNIEDAQDENEELPPPEYRIFLTKYTEDFARAAMNKWWELGDKYWGMFGRGF
jgi:dipeptidase